LKGQQGRKCETEKQIDLMGWQAYMQGHAPCQHQVGDREAEGERQRMKSRGGEAEGERQRGRGRGEAARRTCAS